MGQTILEWYVKSGFINANISILNQVEFSSDSECALPNGWAERVKH